MPKFSVQECQAHVHDMARRPNAEWTDHSGFPSRFTGVDDNAAISTPGSDAAQQQVGLMEMAWDCATHAHNPQDGLSDQDLVPYPVAAAGADSAANRRAVQSQISHTLSTAGLSQLEGDFQGIYADAVRAASRGQTW